MEKTKAKEEIVFEIFPMTELNVSAPESLEEELKLRIVQIKNSAQNYGGFVVYEDEQTMKVPLEVNGKRKEKKFHEFFFRIKFSDYDLMTVWKASIIA